MILFCDPSAMISQVTRSALTSAKTKGRSYFSSVCPSSIAFTAAGPQQCTPGVQRERERD
uniref:Uncharacterized protein n=1 Tax=Anguilla anguilla TaxID=7936 RepID=A0A0E9RQC2_ANGAN